MPKSSYSWICSPRLLSPQYHLAGAAIATCFASGQTSLTDESLQIAAQCLPANQSIGGEIKISHKQPRATSGEFCHHTGMYRQHPALGARQYIATATAFVETS
jgi:hypothetical protein